jgi:TonB family protein
MISAMKVTAIQRDWVGRVVDGRFTLLQWLGASSHSSVFLTELRGEPPQKAALKLMPANVEARIAFAANAGRAHSHLLSVLQNGMCEIDGVPFAFVLTEYADEVLSEILPMRPLAPEEVKEMLGPVLDSLRSLHLHGLVHGGLKPSNILVVNDELKLSSDSLQLAGSSANGTTALTIYDAPERAHGNVTPASDIWSLGVTIVEALTRQTPEWNRLTDREVRIPEAIPQPFAAIVEGCLRVDPARRPTLNSIWDRLGFPAPVVEARPAADVRPSAAAAPPHPAKPVAATKPVTPAKPTDAATPNPPAAPTPSEAPVAAARPASTPPQPNPAAKAASIPEAQAQRKSAAKHKPKQMPPPRPTPAARIEPITTRLDAIEDEPRRSSRPSSSFDDEAQMRRKPRSGVLLVVVLVMVAAVVLLWARSHGTSPATKSSDQPPAQSSAPATVVPETRSETPPPTQAPPEPAQQPQATSATPSEAAPASGQSGAGAVNGAVATRVVPDVPASASRTIHGTVNVRVRVNVSPTGEVTDTGFDSAGPSKYFSRISMEAARKWKFTPAQVNGRPIASVWMLHFVFKRENTGVTSEQTAP